jgi:hypothetical protein
MQGTGACGGSCDGLATHRYEPTVVGERIGKYF